MLSERLTPLIAGAATLAAVASAAAQPEAPDAETRIFTAFGVHVDERAATVAEARARALAVGQRRALRRLYEKLVERDDVYRLPVVGQTELSRLVRGLEIFNERSSSVRYIADLNVTFDAEAMRRLLANSGVPFSQSGGRAVLVLPVLAMGGAHYLFEPENTWAAAWSKIDTQNRLLDFRFAEGGFRDRRDLSVRQVLQKDADRISELAARYGAEDVLLAVAEPVRAYGNGSPAVDFRYLRLLSPADETSGRIRGAVGAAQDALLRQAAQAIVERLEIDWKTQTLVDFGQVFELRAEVPVSTLEDWVDLQSRIGRVSMIQSLEIERLALPVSRVRLHYIGGANQLILTLNEVDVALERLSGGWVLRPKEAADAGATTAANAGRP